MTHAKIASVGAYVPQRRMHNDELAEIVDTSDEWIYSHTGIRYRHIAGEDQSAADLAVPAGARALERAGLDPDDIDLVLLATSTPDYIGLPSTACVVQDRLGIKDAGAMDLMAACSGFVYGMETARVYIEAGAARNVLLIGSEVYSKIINWKDRRSCVLFGDGAGAVVISATDAPGNTPSDGPAGASQGAALEVSPGAPSRILPAILGSQGSGAESLYRSHGGTRHAYRPGQTDEADMKLKMDGRKVYNFAVSSVGFVIGELLQRHNLEFNDLDWVIPHQANERIISAAARRGGWDPGRFYMNIAEYANTSAASIPIAMNEMYEKGLLHRGKAYLTVGFGSGLTYGGSIFYY
jgi:3-oxoacyl-[acyl-carrier-protein] synthase III